MKTVYKVVRRLGVGYQSLDRECPLWREYFLGKCAVAEGNSLLFCFLEEESARRFSSDYGYGSLVLLCHTENEPIILKNKVYKNFHSTLTYFWDNYKEFNKLDYVFNPELADTPEGSYGVKSLIPIHEIG